ncbi:MAG: SDR family oxidoreductase [Hyphomonadaceae bacterium]|nr:SDR family oxidoreductase [Hyphomonadaceae bacterium]
MGTLSGKTAIISGGSDGIGRAIAERLASDGADVVICARNQDKLDATVAAIKDAGGSASCVCLDVSDANAYAELVNQVAKDKGIDILVNNAPHVGMGMIADTGLDDFQQNFKVNMDAPYMGTRAAMSHMTDEGGSIINISSINGERAMPGMSGYSASKAALIHFTRAASMEGARSGIRVNAVTPGPIMTPGTEAWFQMDPDAGAAIANANPMGRIGTPEEVANVVAFLASDEASYVTGASIPVDGGKANELHVPG